MTRYINPSTRHDGANQIVVSKRIAPADVYEAPFDGGLYVRSNGDWVPVPPIPEPTWQAWTPVIKGTTTDPTMGNSTLVGRYLQVGKTVSLRLYLQIGSTFNPGVGAYMIPTLPVAPRSDYWQPLLVAASLASPAVGDYAGVAKIEGSAGIVRIHIDRGGTTVSLGALGDDNFSTGNRLLISGTYEAA